MLSKKPNSKLKSQINEQNPRSKTTNSHGFREREREREREEEEEQEDDEAGVAP